MLVAAVVDDVGELLPGRLDGRLAEAAGAVRPSVLLEALEQDSFGQVADVGKAQAEAAEAMRAMFARSGRP